MKYMTGTRYRTWSSEGDIDGMLELPSSWDTQLSRAAVVAFARSLRRDQAQAGSPAPRDHQPDPSLAEATRELDQKWREGKRGK
jgi:hypothetical protein